MNTKTIDELLIGFDMEVQPIKIPEPTNAKTVVVQKPEIMPSGFKDVDYNVYGPFEKYVNNIGYEILSLDRFQLERRLKPKIVDHKIKTAFLNELVMCIKTQSEMTFSGVYRNVCSQHSLSERIKNPEFVAWLMEPLADVESDYNAIISMGVQHMEQVMNANTEITDEDGNVTGIDLDIASEKMKIIKFVTERTQGQAIARSEVKKLSINISENQTIDRYKLKDPTSLKEIEEKLKLLKDDQQYGNNKNESDQ